MVRRLVLFLNRKNLAPQLPHDSARDPDRRGVTFNGEWNTLQGRRNALDESHHRVQRCYGRAFATQQIQFIAAQRAAGVERDFAFPA